MSDQLLIYSHQTRLTLEQAQNLELVQWETDRMVADLLAKLVEDGREPIPGSTKLVAEREDWPGEPLPQSWWRRLLRLPRRYAPGPSFYVVRISLTTVEAAA